MSPGEAPQRRPLWRSVAGELVITLLVSVLVWLTIGFGNKGFLQARGLAYSLAIGFSVYSTVRVLELWLGPRLGPLPVPRQRILRTLLYFAGGCLGYLIGMGLAQHLLGARSGGSPSEVGFAVAMLGVMAVAIGLSFNAFGHLQSRLRASVVRLKEAEFAEKELELARSIQRRLLPPAEIEGDGFHVAARSLPARTVAGDFYDFFPLADGAFAVVVADVAGKGIGASLIMASVKAMLPFLAANRTVADTLAELNRRLVAELGAREFVALSYARFDAANGEVELGNAGLPDPYLMRGKEAPRSVVAPGPRLPLGALAAVEYQTVTLRLERGDRLVFLTDGLPEAPVAASGEPFGYAAFEHALADAGEGSPAELLENLVSKVESRVLLPRDDDWTLVALTRIQEGAG